MVRVIGRSGEPLGTRKSVSDSVGRRESRVEHRRVGVQGDRHQGVAQPQERVFVEGCVHARGDVRDRRDLERDPVGESRSTRSGSSIARTPCRIRSGRRCSSVCQTFSGPAHSRRAAPTGALLGYPEQARERGDRGLLAASAVQSGDAPVRELRGDLERALGGLQPIVAHDVGGDANDGAVRASPAARPSSGLERRGPVVVERLACADGVNRASAYVTPLAARSSTTSLPSRAKSSRWVSRSHKAAY